MFLILIIILSFILFTNIILFICTYLFIKLRIEQIIAEHQKQYDFINHLEKDEK